MDIYFQNRKLIFNGKKPHTFHSSILFFFVLTVYHHGPQVRLQHRAVMLNHGLGPFTHGACGPHGAHTFRAGLHHGVGVQLIFILQGKHCSEGRLF